MEQALHYTLFLTPLGGCRAVFLRNLERGFAHSIHFFARQVRRAKGWRIMRKQGVYTDGVARGERHGKDIAWGKATTDGCVCVYL